MDNLLLTLEKEFNASEDSVDGKIKALNNILANFPLLFGYWLKLIDLSKDKAATWKLALERCPVLDLWTEYLDSPFGSSLESAQEAVRILGFHFQSHPLWDALIQRSQNDPKAIGGAIEIPLYSYAQFYQFAYEQSIESPEVLERKSVEISSLVTGRWEFESKLKRPYFHPHELDSSELETWNQYLDYIERNSRNDDETKQLYERCLVTTALYPQYWVRFLSWLDKKAISSESAFTNSLHYHPKNKILRLLYSRFLEVKGEINNSRAQLLTSDEGTQNECESDIVSYLVEFDRRNGIEPPQSGDSQYLVELVKQTGDISFLPQEQLSNSPDLFYSDQIDPKVLFPLWKLGNCPDAAKYASNLKSHGYLDMYFAVDASLGYHD